MLEATFSLQVDLDNGSAVSVNGYASLWRWSRRRVKRFLSESCLEIDQPGKNPGQLVCATRVATNGQRPRNGLFVFPLAYGDNGTTIGQRPDIEGYTSTKPIQTKEDIVPYLNAITGRGYKQKAKSTLRCINARLREGFTLEDFQSVVNFKWAEWGDNSDMSGYLRPSTLFGPKFDGYLQASKVQRPHLGKEDYDQVDKNVRAMQEAQKSGIKL